MSTALKRIKAGFWPLIIVLCLGAAGAITAPGAAEAAEPLPAETSLVALALDNRGAGISLSGLASGELGGIELAIRRADGWFWDPAISDWKVEPVWQKGTLMPMGATRFTWDESLGAPPVDGENLLLLARAVGRDGRPDPTPAGAHLFVDNVGPTVGKFELDGARWVRSRDVTLTIEATGVKYMQFAESVKALRRAPKRLFQEKARFRLAAGDGLRRIFGAFSDGGGNLAVVPLGGPLVGLDTAPPVIKMLAPAADAKSVSVGSRISAEFIEGSDIDAATLKSESGAGATFYLTRDGRWTTATVAYDAKKKTAVLTPAEPLIEGEMYTANLRPGIGDIAGNRFEDETSWSFRAVEPSPPETKLDALPERVSRRKTVTIKGAAFDPDGVGAVAVFVRDQDGRYWDSTSAVWTAEPFANEAALVRKGEKQTGWHWVWRVPPSDGNRYAVTAAAKDRFLAEDPIPAGTSIMVDNEEPKIEPLILNDGLPVTNSDTITIAGRVTGATEMRFSERPGKLVSEPWRRFSPETTFTLSKKEGKKRVFGQWRDASGNTTRAGQAGSSAGIILDKTGPRVSSTFPHEDADKVNISVMVTANFEEVSLDESSIDGEAFTLVDPDGDVVPANVSFDRLSKSATLTPLEFLKYGAVYKAVLNGRIKDRLGNAIGDDYEWSFKTVGISTHPPGSPRALKVVSTERGDKLTWSPPADDDAGGDFNPPVQGGYNIYRGPSDQGPFELVNKVPAVGLVFYDKDYGRPGRRFYAVRAVDAGGSVGEAGAPKANDEIDTVFNLKAGESAAAMPSNDILRLKLPLLKRPVKLRIRTKEAIGAPPTPMAVFELESSPTVKLRSFSVVLPGDPTGAIVMRRERGGWQPLSGVTYERDPLTRTVTVGPVASKGEYLVVNRTDATPPPAAPAVTVSSREGEPFISWGRINDPESGISAYRLRRTETTMAPETSAAPAVLDLPGSTSEFVDHNAEPGSAYYYWVAAVNGAGLFGPVGGAEPTATPRPMVEHRPRVAGVTNCQSCHIERRVQNEKSLIDCRLCHDGTGSLIVITGYDGRDSLCRTCHALGNDELKLAGAADAGQCGGCHKRSDSPVAAGDSGHAGGAGLGSMACISCHSLHRPGDRKIGYLVDPANTRKSWSGSKSDFCLACHRATGWPAAIEAMARFVPRNILFSAVAAPLFPGWSKTGWKRSGHRRAAECLTCHESHKSPNARLVGFRASKRKYVYFTEYTASEALCYECHRPGGPRGAADLLTLSRSPAGHSADNLNVHSDLETAWELGAMNRHVNCNDCHNVHESAPEAREPFSNKVSGALRGVAGVEPVGSGPGAAPSFAEVNPASREYQICFKCHSSYVKMPPAGLTDFAVKFDPANPSYHPVESRGKNRGVKAAAFVNGWGQTATMYCSDCHSYPRTRGTARGPHGSKYKPMLAGEFGAEAAAGRRDELCYLCHNEKVYKEGRDGSRFEGKGGHDGHVAEHKIGCFECHETHGSTSTDHLIKVIQPFETSGTVVFSHDETGGACTAACHERPAESYRYDHAY